MSSSASTLQGAIAVQQGTPQVAPLPGNSAENEDDPTVDVEGGGEPPDWEGVPFKIIHKKLLMIKTVNSKGKEHFKC